MVKKSAPKYDFDSEAAIAVGDAIGIEWPEGANPSEEAFDESKAVGHLRGVFKGRLKGVPKKDWIECPECHEYTDDGDEIDRCPFCGDEGEDDEGEDEDESDEVDEADEDEDGEEDDGSEEPTDRDAENFEVDPKPVKEPPRVDVTAETKKGKKPAKKSETKKGKKPAKKSEAEKSETAKKDDVTVTGKVEDVTEFDPEDFPDDPAAQLKAEKAILHRAQTNMATAGYDMGLSLKRIDDKGLWKVEGHKTFRLFLKSISISHTLAYDLIRLVSEFDRETFMEVGRKKLLLVARETDPDKREDLLDRAKSGESTRALEEKATNKKRTERTTAAEEGDDEDDEKTPAKKSEKKAEDTISIVSRVGARAETFAFLDRKTREPLKEWSEESYVEIKINEDVSQLLALKVVGKKIVGIVVAYRRNEPAQAATMPAPEKPKKTRGKAARKPAKGKKSGGKKTSPPKLKVVKGGKS